MDLDDHASYQVVCDRLSLAVLDIPDETRLAIIESLVGTRSFWLKVLSNLIEDAARGGKSLGKGKGARKSKNVENASKGKHLGKAVSSRSKVPREAHLHPADNGSDATAPTGTTADLHMV